MARAVLVLALFVLGGWLFYNIGESMNGLKNTSQEYSSAIEMINNLEAPAAGRAY